MRRGQASLRFPKLPWYYDAATDDLLEALARVERTSPGKLESWLRAAPPEPPYPQYVYFITPVLLGYLYE